MDWELRERLRARLRGERGCRVHPAGARTRFAIAYPNAYRVGMSNLGIHVIYGLLNGREDMACERFFLPGREELDRYRRTRTPLMSLETQTPLFRFPLVGFAVSFEMDYFHVLDMLALGHVPLLAAERGEEDPLVIAGGPCATFNPEPLAPFFDAFVIGEGEAVLPTFLDAWQRARADGLPKEELLRRLAGVPGIYVPSLYGHSYAEDGAVRSVRPAAGAPARVLRQWVRDLDAHPAHTEVVTEDTELNLYLLETARGCGRHCRFCMAGYCFRRPRNRSLAVLLREVERAVPYGKRIGLMGAAISDYPGINALCAGILGRGLSMSVASFRADSVTRELVEALAQSGLRTLTLAPEAGSARMRSAINKGIREEHLFRAMELGLAAGIRNYRLYFMVGLPFEEDEDVAAIPALAARLWERMGEGGRRGTLTLSVNPFVPKPFTPFQWVPMAGRRRIEAAYRRIREGLRGRRGIEILAESSREAEVQGILARGDRRVARALLAAHGKGGAKAFRHAMGEAGLDAGAFLFRERAKEELFPWDTLDMGVNRAYLWAELERARRLEPTRACFEGCLRCGACSHAPFGIY